MSGLSSRCLKKKVVFASWPSGNRALRLGFDGLHEGGGDSLPAGNPRHQELGNIGTMILVGLGCWNQLHGPDQTIAAFDREEMNLAGTDSGDDAIPLAARGRQLE